MKVNMTEVAQRENTAQPRAELISNDNRGLADGAGAENNRDQRRDQRSGQIRKNGQNGPKSEKRPPISREDALSKVAAALHANRNIAGRVVASLGNNAVVMVARSTLGKAMYDVAGDVDRALFVVENSVARGFDPVKAARRAEIEVEIFALVTQLADVAARLTVEFHVKDNRDSAVKERVRVLRADQEAANQPKKTKPASPTGEVDPLVQIADTKTTARAAKA